MKYVDFKKEPENHLSIYHNHESTPQATHHSHKRISAASIIGQDPQKAYVACRVVAFGEKAGTIGALEAYQCLATVTVEAPPEIENWLTRSVA